MSESMTYGNKKLKKGVTTGLCAAAATKVATISLLSKEDVHNVSIQAKDKTIVNVDIVSILKKDNTVSCTVIKNAGDDPDVTNGIDIVATVYKIECGIDIKGGVGVGVVTKAGLKIPIGHSAINPVPLEMIEKEVKSVANLYSYEGGIKVVISVPKGVSVAKKTMNERLGIVGGISILGTTGIVEPMSDKAVVDTIKTEIDVHTSNNKYDLIVTPGNYGRDFAKDMLNINIDDAIKCSNFIGDTLDYAVYANIKHITLIGHVGKLIKLAGGIMNTHSSIADCRMEIMATHCAIAGATHCAIAGATQDIIIKIMKCITVDAVIAIIKDEPFYKKVLDSVEKKIGFYITQRIRGNFPVRFIVFTQEYGVLIDSEIY